MTAFYHRSQLTTQKELIASPIKQNTPFALHDVVLSILDIVPSAKKILG